MRSTNAFAQWFAIDGLLCIWRGITFELRSVRPSDDFKNEFRRFFFEFLWSLMDRFQEWISSPLLWTNWKSYDFLQDYAVLESTAITINPLDLGSSRHSISGSRSWRKTYSKEYVWGQLIGWYKQSVADPGASLVKAARGCLTLPDVSSCYAKSMQHDFKWAYGHRHREKMICHMVRKHTALRPFFWSVSGVLVGCDIIAVAFGLKREIEEIEFC